MGRIQILEKLSNKLKSTPSSEQNVVYILSRVRKILEIDNYPKQFETLNFYCNFALHSIIDRVPRKISKKLNGLREGSDYSMIGNKDFHKEFLNFLDKHNLPNFYKNKDFRITGFNKLLHAIYSDTPIIIKAISKYQIIFDKNGIITISPVK